MNEPIPENNNDKNIESVDSIYVRETDINKVLAEKGDKRIQDPRLAERLAYLEKTGGKNAALILEKFSKKGAEEIDYREGEEGFIKDPKLAEELAYTEAYEGKDAALQLEKEAERKVSKGMEALATPDQELNKEVFTTIVQKYGLEDIVKYDPVGDSYIIIYDYGGEEEFRSQDIVRTTLIHEKLGPITFELSDNSTSAGGEGVFYDVMNRPSFLMDIDVNPIFLKNLYEMEKDNDGATLSYKLKDKFEDKAFDQVLNAEGYDTSGIVINSDTNSAWSKWYSRFDTSGYLEMVASQIKETKKLLVEARDSKIKPGLENIITFLDNRLGIEEGN
ncbi:hypothetical protein K0B04_00355 [Patescibacteria group bacterium]|nr:hypothetical protein [Patescibacteria group bacterium]